MKDGEVGTGTGPMVASRETPFTGDDPTLACVNFAGRGSDVGTVKDSRAPEIFSKMINCLNDQHAGSVFGDICSD